MIIIIMIIIIVILRNNKNSVSSNNNNDPYKHGDRYHHPCVDGSVMSTGMLPDTVNAL